MSQKSVHFPLRLPVYHFDGCKQVAFYWVGPGEPIDGEWVDADAFELLDGTKPTNGEQVICGFCGERIFWGGGIPMEALEKRGKSP